ncbi:hypothetical protein GF336_07445 [Candidatus Woesearchaeota archaeon]|nr:hypothetical protein [Candidatus Woesearchaeota archaeon]
MGFKKGCLLVILTIAFVLFSISVFGDINTFTLDNGDTAFNTTGFDLRSCETSDGGEVFVEADFSNDGGYSTMYYYKFDSNDNVVVSKKLIQKFDGWDFYDFDLECEGNEAYLVSSLNNGTLDSNNLTVNITGYSTIQTIHLDSSGNANVLSEHLKDYVVFQVDLEVGDDLQVLVSTYDELNEDINSSETYDISKSGLNYITLDKSNGNLLSEDVLFDELISYFSVAKDSSDNLSLIYLNYTGSSNSDIYVTKINTSGDIIFSPVMLNDESVHYTDFKSLNDIIVDSSNNIHSVWVEEDSSEDFQTRYAKLDSDGSILVNSKDLTSLSNNEYDFTVFMENKQDSIYIYYGATEQKLWGEGGISLNYKVDWINISFAGNVLNSQTLLTDHILYHLGQVCVGEEPTGTGDPDGDGEPCQNCGGTCTDDDNPSVPEFSSFGIIISLMLIALIGMFIIKRNGVGKI